jgi:hypothetical protein
MESTLSKVGFKKFKVQEVQGSKSSRVQGSRFKVDH